MEVLPGMRATTLQAQPYVIYPISPYISPYTAPYDPYAPWPKPYITWTTSETGTSVSVPGNTCWMAS
jgi:hypothetical protein